MLIRPEITAEIIEAAIAVHRQVGPGLLESVYAACLAKELGLRGLVVERERPVELAYRGLVLPNAFRADLVVAGQVIVEVKAVDYVLPLHVSQLLTYLRLSGLEIGLLVNFNVRLLKHGIRRVVWSRNASKARRSPASDSLPSIS